MGCGNSTAGGAGGRGATGTTKDAFSSQAYFQASLEGIKAKQKNLYQMMTKGGTMGVCMLVCHQMQLPWFPVRRKLHQKKEINTSRSKQLEFSAKTSYQYFRESCLSAEDFYIYVAFQRARQIRTPKNLNCCKFQLRVKLKVQR